MIRTMLVVGGVVTLAAASSAEAARCPAGQIYRVSKKVCQDKAAAIRAGVYKPRKSRSRKKARQQSPKPEAAPETKSAANPSPEPAVATAAPAGNAGLPQPAPRPVPRPDSLKGAIAASGSSAAPALQAIRSVDPSIKPLQDNVKSPQEALRKKPSDMQALARVARAGFFAPLPSVSFPPGEMHESSPAAELKLLEMALQKHVNRNRARYIRSASGD